MTKTRFAFGSHVVIASIAVYIFIVFFPALLHSGELLQTDQPLWAAATHVWFTDVIPNDSWVWNSLTDRSSAGLVLGNSYSAHVLLLCLLRFVVSSATAVKLSMILCAFLFLTAVYCVATRYTTRTYALLCGVLVFAPVFDNLVSGMWYNYLSVACALFFWYACDRYVEGPGKAKWILLAILACASAIYSHPVGSMMTCAIWAAYFLNTLLDRDRRTWTNVIPLLAIPVVGALLAAPQIAATLALSAPAPSAPGHDVAMHLTGGMEFFRRLLVIRVWGATGASPFETAVMVWQVLCVGALSAVGAWKLYAENPMRSTPIVFLFLMNCVVLSRVFVYLHPIVGQGLVLALNDFYDRLQIVSQVYVGLLSVLGLVAIWQHRHSARWRRTVTGLAIIAGVTVCSISAKPVWQIYVSGTEQLATIDVSPVKASLVSFWSWARVNVDTSRERIFVEDTYGSVHWNGSENPESWKTHALALTGIYTNVRQVGGWCGFATRFARAHEEGGKLFSYPGNDSEDDARWAAYERRAEEELRSINCKYVVAASKRFTGIMSRVSFLQRVATFGQFSVFKNDALTPSWAYRVKDNEPVQLQRYSSTQYELKVDNCLGDQVHLCLAYHPNWVAYVGNARIPITNRNELMALNVPADARSPVKIVYVIDRREPAVLAIAGLFAFAGTGVMLRRKRSL